MTRALTPSPSQIVVLIDEVDVPNRVVHARDKTNVLVQVSFREAPGAALRIPNQGEKWTAQRIGFHWHLDKRLDSVAEHTYVKEQMVPGDARIAADGTLHVIGDRIIFNGQPIGATTHSIFTTDGSSKIYTLGIAPIHARTVQAFINGLLLDPRSYTVNGSNVTFVSAPAAGTLVVYYQRSGFAYEDAMAVIGKAQISAVESKIP